jgi:hypothetical protein
MKYVPQKDDVITIIENDKTIKQLVVLKSLDEHSCLLNKLDFFEDNLTLLICRNSHDIVYNVMIIDMLFNVYDIKRNNEFIVNNHDIFLYVKES